MQALHTDDQLVTQTGTQQLQLMHYITLTNMVGNHTHTHTHRWHMDYMDLLVRKRMALAAWRAKRDQQRSKSQAQAALLETETAAQVCV